MHLTKPQLDLYSRVVAALVLANASEVLADGPGMAHRIADAAMHQVDELRTRVRADRIRKSRRARR